MVFIHPNLNNKKDLHSDFPLSMQATHPIFIIVFGYLNLK